MKRRAHTSVIVVLAIFALAAGWYGVSAVTATSEPFDFQPLVSGPLDTLRKVEMPSIAVPVWLEGGR